MKNDIYFSKMRKFLPEVGSSIVMNGKGYVNEIIQNSPKDDTTPAKKKLPTYKNAWLRDNIVSANMWDYNYVKKGKYGENDTVRITNPVPYMNTLTFGMYDTNPILANKNPVERDSEGRWSEQAEYNFVYFSINHILDDRLKGKSLSRLLGGACTYVGLKKFK